MADARALNSLPMKCGAPLFDIEPGIGLESHWRYLVVTSNWSNVVVLAAGW